MGLFSFLKKSPEAKQKVFNPYKSDAVNQIYHLLFCDNPELYKPNLQEPYSYPFDILFTETSSVSELQTVIDDIHTDSRIKLLAYNRQMALGHIPTQELIAVIVEVSVAGGLDVLASFYDGTARYINHNESMIVFEKNDDAQANELTDALYQASLDIVNQTGPWDKPRRPYPTQGNARITFLVSDGIYFGEGPIDVLFNDPLASPAMHRATMLMQYLMDQAAKA